MNELYLERFKKKLNPGSFLEFDWKPAQPILWSSQKTSASIKQSYRFYYTTFYIKKSRSITTVWKCTEDWDALYAKWATVEFSQLDVDDCEEGTAMIELELEEAKGAVFLLIMPMRETDTKKLRNFEKLQFLNDNRD